MNSFEFNAFPKAEPMLEENTALRILIIEDEPDVARMLRRVIESCGKHEVRLESAPPDFAGRLRDFAPDLVLTDLMMPDLNGFEVIRQTKAVDEDLPVVVVSAFATLENAVEAVKAGAFDFLAKPFSPESVELMLAKVARNRRLRARAASLCRQMQSRDGDLAALLGESSAMQNLRTWICRVREPRTNVLIEGESGTGKELVARAIHAGRGPFVAINMAAIPDELAESELFGHRKGAFTGAARDRIGLLQEAGDGVLFLDEVNAMSPLLQAKLLRVLQEKRMRPVGANKEVELNFRLLAASNRELETLIETGQFRRDLYHRLNVLSVRLPPLRERREDIPLLAEHFVQRYARAHGRHLRRLAPEAAAALMAADWQGNVRELENVVEQAVILCPEGRTDLPLSSLPARLGGEGWQLDAAPGAQRPATLDEVERQYILSVLRQSGGNKAQAARILDIDYKTLLRKLDAAAAASAE